MSSGPAEMGAIVSNSELRKRVAQEQISKANKAKPPRKEAFSGPENALLQQWLAGWVVVQASDQKEATIRETAEQIIQREIEWGKHCIEVKLSCKQAGGLKGTDTANRGLEALCKQNSVSYARAIRAARMAEYESVCDKVIAECRKNGTIPSRTLCLNRIDSDAKDKGRKKAARHAKQAIGNQPTTATATRDLARAVPALQSIRSRFEDDNIREETRAEWASNIAMLRTELEGFEGKKRREPVTKPIQVVEDFIALPNMVRKMSATAQKDIAILLEEVDEALAAIRAALGRKVLQFEPPSGEEGDAEEAGE